MQCHTLRKTCPSYEMSPISQFRFPHLIAPNSDQPSPHYPQFLSSIMLATLLMSCIPFPSNIIILCPTKPTPFRTTTTRTTRTLDMIAPINLLTKSSARITRLGIRFDPPGRGTFILSMERFRPLLLASFVPVARGLAGEARIKSASPTAEEFLFIYHVSGLFPSREGRGTAVGNDLSCIALRICTPSEIGIRFESAAT